MSSAHAARVKAGQGDGVENKSADAPRAPSAGCRHLGNHVTRPGGTIAATGGVHTRNDVAATPQDRPRSRRSDFRSSSSDCPHRENGLILFKGQQRPFWTARAQDLVGVGMF